MAKKQNVVLPRETMRVVEGCLRKIGQALETSSLPEGFAGYEWVHHARAKLVTTFRIDPIAPEKPGGKIV